MYDTSASGATLGGFISLLNKTVNLENIDKFIGVSGFWSMTFTIPSLGKSDTFLCTNVICGGPMIIFYLFPINVGVNYSGIQVLAYSSYGGEQYGFCPNVGDPEIITSPISLSGSVAVINMVS